jgi:hypothetical protein
MRPSPPSARSLSVSGGKQNAGGSPGGTDPHGDGLEQTGTKESPRIAPQVQERSVRELLIDRPGLGLGDRRPGETSPLDRRVDRLDDGLEELRIRIVPGDGIAEPGERRRMEPRQLDLQRQVCRGQIPNILEQLIERSIGESPELPRSSPAGMSQESASKALLGRATLHTAAPLRLATRATRTGIITPNLRHD